MQSAGRHEEQSQSAQHPFLWSGDAVQPTDAQGHFFNLKMEAVDFRFVETMLIVIETCRQKSREDSYPE